ncbi:glutathione S-transferase family protein [Cochlodiniinecator piscidefendens]|uniref:glutathione S-transferase family protein n=1 Tax=Cochlodiniinecator piscidefendens TaxID=2715756 RepID=UPI00140D34A6|nr:glutathione S-transferase family protein [Cochlodiniinecator piscidefendens]
MKLQLHYAPGTIASAAAITCFELGIDVDLVRVDFSAAEQTKAAYHKINPKGRVPALVTPEGILTETGALLEYLAQHTTSSSLLPSDPFKAAKMREMMYYLASTMHVNHAHKLRGHRWADTQSSHQDMTAKVPETMAQSCRYVEENIAGPFVLGEEITLADIYLFTICTWLAGDGVDIATYPKLNQHHETMKSRPSVVRAAELGIV